MAASADRSGSWAQPSRPTFGEAMTRPLGYSSTATTDGDLVPQQTVEELLAAIRRVIADLHLKEVASRHAPRLPGLGDTPSMGRYLLPSDDHDDWDAATDADPPNVIELEIEKAIVGVNLTL